MAILSKVGGNAKLQRLMQQGIRYLPCRLRRIVFIGLMLSYLSNDKNPDLKLIEKINDSFKLANNPKAYELPMAVKSIVWRDFDIKNVDIEVQEVDGKKLLTSVSKVNLCYYVTTHVPEWIKYASAERIYTDMMVLVDHLEKTDNFIYSH